MAMSNYALKKLNDRIFYNFNGYLLLTLCVAALFFSIAAYAFRHGYKQLGTVMISGFGLEIAGFIGYAFYRILFVICPECLGRTKSFVNKSDRKWIARCQKCAIDWDIGLAAEDDVGSS